MFHVTTKIQTDGNLDVITTCLKFIEENLSKCKLKADEKIKFELFAEEIIAKMIENNDDNKPISIKKHSFLGKIKIRIVCKGKPFEAEDIRRRMSFGDIVTNEDLLASSSKLLDRAIDNHLKLNHRNGCNVCDIYAKVKSPSLIQMTFIAMVLGLISGLL